MADLRNFFNPQSVVVVGATTQQHKLGYGVSRNLISCGYRGEVYFVNRKGGVLFGQQMFTSLDQLPAGVDLAVLVIPAPYVAETINACSHIGIKNIIIISGGFSEIGATGARYEADSLKISLAEDLIVLGPNCIGVIDTHAPIDTTFLQPPSPKPGDIGFITHSGALGAGVIDWAKGEGFSFSKMISLGNQMLLNESDILVPLAKDPETNVIALYLESVKEGDKFVNNARQATQEKPIVAHKVGRTEAGKRAASSHTGAMAGVDKAFDAAFRRGGVIRADTTEDMFNWAKALAWSPVPLGNRVAVLTNAGGPGVTATDAVAANGLRMAEISNVSKDGLHAILPEAASAENPVDMLASASPQDYAACLEILLSDKQVDMVLVISPPPPMFSAARIVEACIPIVRLHGNKPVVF
jgi:acyl-CoA synthetase (NDP forming)